MGLVLKRAGDFITCPGKPVSARIPAGGLQGCSKSRLQWADRAGREASSRSTSPPGQAVIYDGTFSGMLSVIFDLFAHKVAPGRILAQGKRGQIGLFESPVRFETDEAKASKAWRRFGEIFGEGGRRHIYRAFLSEDEAVEELIYSVVAEAVEQSPAGRSPASSDVWARIESLSSKVGREAHRMQGLVRFQDMSKGFYAATINPRHDVLPLICSHFEHRYADQHWVIYDVTRDYGLYWDTVETRTVHLDWRAFGAAHPLAAEEEIFQQLWKSYFDSLTIPERRSPDLHLRMLPRRYWPFLPEKRAPRQ
jgi:probable DNA metabolism protein